MNDWLTGQMRWKNVCQGHAHDFSFIKWNLKKKKIVENALLKGWDISEFKEETMKSFIKQKAAYTKGFHMSDHKELWLTKFP